MARSIGGDHQFAALVQVGAELLEMMQTVIKPRPIRAL